jgi:tetratricopeptide (TPR) repeat protein
LRFDDEGGAGPLVIYVAGRSCRTCSADLEALQRAARPPARLLAAGEDPSDDRALRQALQLYRRDWPMVNGPSLAEAFELVAPAAFVVARGGWSAAVVAPPFELTLPPVLGVFAFEDVSEPRPRPEWNRRPVERPQPSPQPELLPEGLAPGEDDAAPAEFDAAVRAYRQGRYAEALRLFTALEASGDGFLLPPEARLNRALCLRRLGRREEARKLLLRTGDSRFQEALDRALEQ